MEMGVDAQIKFSRVRKGYAFKEVDDAFDEMQREINELKAENSRLLDLVKEYTVKIQMIADSTKRLDEERAAERLRLAEENP